MFVNGLFKFIFVVGSVVGSVIIVVIIEGIGFVYLKVLEICFNDEIGEVKLFVMDMIKFFFKENYFSLDIIKKLKL